MISEPQISLNCPLSAFSAFFAVKKAWNPAWRQALLGRPAIAGCSPMLPRCGTNLAWRQGCRQNPPGNAFFIRWTLSPAGNSSIFEHNNDKNKKLKLFKCKKIKLKPRLFRVFWYNIGRVTNSRHKGKREPLGRVESKPESISLPARVSRMCVFPAPNSARLARNFPLFRLIPGYLRLFTSCDRKA